MLRTVYSFIHPCHFMITTGMGVSQERKEIPTPFLSPQDHVFQKENRERRKGKEKVEEKQFKFYNGKKSTVTKKGRGIEWVFLPFLKQWWETFTIHTILNTLFSIEYFIVHRCMHELRIQTPRVLSPILTYSLTTFSFLSLVWESYCFKRTPNNIPTAE